jgi:hypothetical protein
MVRRGRQAWSKVTLPTHTLELLLVRERIRQGLVPLFLSTPRRVRKKARSCADVRTPRSSVHVAMAKLLPRRMWSYKRRSNAR